MIFLGHLHAVCQHVVYAEECRFVVADYAAVRRDVHLAVGEGIECVDRLVARCSGNEMDEDGGVV